MINKIKCEVDSSVFTDLKYSPHNRKLTIKFVSGSIYQYENVPYIAFQELCDADSHGSYFNSNIRNNYNFKRKS